MHKEIKNELLQILAIVNSWAEGENVSPIERDIVLDGLKRSYSMLAFPVVQPVAAPVEVVAAPVHPAVVSIEEVVAPEEIIAAHIPVEPPQAEPETWQPQDEQPEVVPMPELVAAMMAMSEMKEDLEPEQEPEPEVQPELETPEQPAAAAPVEEPKPTPPAVESAATLFGDEHIPAPRSRFNRSIILSLYGDEQCPADKSSQDAMMAGEAPGCAPTPPSAPVAADPRPVLGEVMGGGERLGDTFSRQAPAEDLASKLASQQTVSLRRSIGINDKFLIMSEVFGGSASAYERAIDELDAFTDLDELMIHIHESYNWNPRNEGVRTLVEILTRKFS